MEIKNLQNCDEEIITKENDQSTDNINFSINNGENLEPMLLESKNSAPDFITQQLLDFFSIRISYMEESYSRKEIEVTDLMFALHAITLIANEMKAQLPNPIIGKRKVVNFDSNEEDLNSSKMSTMSRRSNSSSRSGKKDFVQQKTNPRDKMALFSPKVAINIMFNQEKDGNSSSSLDKSIIRKSQDMAKSKSLIKNSNGAKNTKEDEKRIANKKLTQSPVNTKDKLKIDKCEIDSKPGFHKQNARKVNSDGDNLIKKNQKNVPASNISTANNSNITKLKVNALKGSSNEKNPKVVANQASTTKINNNSSPKANIVKNLGSNYNSNSVGVAKSNSEKKELEKLKKNNETPKSAELFSSNNSKSNYKLEPKTLKNQLNIKNINITAKNDEDKKNSSSDSRVKQLNNIIDSTITNNILKFLSLKDKINFKNVNQKFRKLFFADEINELSDRINSKKLEENPCYFVNIPKNLEEVVKNKHLALSEYIENYNENPSFNNLVNILYTIAFTGDSTFSQENLIKQKFLFQKVEDLDKYISKNSNGNSIYCVFPLLIKNLRYKNEVYLAIKDILDENDQAFNLRGLTEELFVL